MAKKKNSDKASTPAEKDFRLALSRLVAGTPRNQKLKLLASRNRLKVSISNVALEAGRSRTLIGSADCAYPDIRSEIIRARTPATRSKSQDEIIKELRTKIKVLTEDRAVIATQLADAVGEVWRLKKQLDFQREVNKAKSSKKVVPFKR